MVKQLIEKMELHDTLNPKLWQGNTLRPEVEEKLNEIVDQFILELHDNDIPIKMLDARLVGSNASFNYTDNSDLDVHIVANFEDTSCDVPVLNLLYNFFKKNFNDKYNLSIHGIPVELYVEDINSSAVSNGIYSLLNNVWIKFPEPIEIPDIDITNIFNIYEDKYNKVMTNKNAEMASDLIDELYLLRKDSIAIDGEYGEGNLVFKEFRNKGYLDNLKQLLVDETSKELSLESLKEDLNSIDKDKIFDFIKNNFHQSSYPDIGLGYILPDGYFLILGSMGAHIGVDDTLFENGLISEDPYSYNYSYPNLILVDEFNAIRYNDGENLGDEYGNPYIQLPKKKPTYKQFDSLESWIDSLDFDKKLFVDGVEYNLEEINSNYIINKIKKYYATGVLQESLILEDKESQKLFQAFQHYLGTRRERISNPSGSGINKDKNIQDVKHHKDNTGGKERANDIEIKDFRKHSSNHYKTFQNAFNYFLKKIKKLLPNISNNDLTILINKLSDEASIKMFQDKLDTIINKYEQYNDKLDDLKNLLDTIRNKYKNNEFDIKLNESDEEGDWGYHYGDLGNKADRRNNFGSRNSGGFGTGTYFVSTPISQRKDGGAYKNRPEHKIDFSKYNLFRPRNNEEAYKLHNALLTFNNMESDFKETPPTWDEVLTEFEKMSNEYWAPLNALDDEDYSTPVKLNKKPLLQYIKKYIRYCPYKITKDDNLMDIARDIEKELIEEASNFEKALHNLSNALHYYNEDKLRKIVINALKDKSYKSPSTLIMQSLGYDGVDVRHLNHDAQGLAGLDNFGFGSVIYDLKGEDK